jgi:hypothetical protein
MAKFATAIIDAQMRTRVQPRKLQTFRKQFIAKGCGSYVLNSLLGEYRRASELNRSHKEEVRSTIEELNGLHHGLNEISSKIEKLQTKELSFLSNRTLTRSIPGPILGPFDTTLMRTGAENLKRAAVYLDRTFRSGRWRKNARAEALAKIYFIGKHYAKLNGKKVTYGNIAALLTEYECEEMGITNKDSGISEDAVRKAVRREVSRRKGEK